MTKLQTQKGFTLVELAIVMTIIGLLIGGILKGQELLNNARVTATIAQVRAFEAATTTFRDKYDALPGDLVNASARVPGCAAACNNGSTTNGSSGDGSVGLTNWATATPAFASQLATVTAGANPQTATGAETALFWAHLALADLIGGVNASWAGAGGAWTTNGAVNVTHPGAKIGTAAWVVGNISGTILPGSVAAAGSGPSGLVLALAATPSTTLGTTAGSQPLIATRAAQIDRKMDDGRPALGFVQAYGTAATCFADLAGAGAAGSAAAAAYRESSTSSDCGLVIRIQG